jgi:phosphoglycolate phosphatase-like HAD superfamily hydrolase
MLAGMRLPRVAIFDFDGTLADSFSEVVKTYREVAPTLGLRPPSDAEIAEYRRMTPTEALRVSGIPAWQLPRLVLAVRSALHARVDAILPFPGIEDALRELRAEGSRCFVLSSNSRENIRSFLARHAMEDAFDLLSCGASMFGKGAQLRKLVRRAQLEGSQVLYVGDEVRDVVAAREAGVGSVAVTWGYAERSVLEVAGPDGLVDAPRELARVVADALAAR